ncbi:MAG: valine--pyruvate transaminase [Spirochaetota bacterium]
MKRSLSGQRFTSDSGILQLMDDLGKALSGPRKKYMLGGGNPALIPEVATVWRDEMRAMLDDPTRFDRVVGQYDTPQGRPSFLRAVARMLNDEYGWGLTDEHVAVTNGSQSAFFMLFMLFAGPADEGSSRKILFPLMPEYIGYADQSVRPDDFVSYLPTIEQIDEHTHKYHIDFDALEITPDTAAICVSRPTNPSGNVLTDTEVERLDALAREHDVPLFIDNAYGTPFPDIIFRDARPMWNENVVLSMSLSKIGLPSLRTGILVARPEIIRLVSSMNAVLSLANGTVGQALTERLFEDGRILSLSREVIRPYYRRKRDHAVACIRRSFGERFPWSIHRPEGSLFLWVWFKELPGTTVDLYERLKARDVVVVPGKYFSFGGTGNEHWDHPDKCIRLNYAMDDADVERGIEIIAEEAASMWS